MTQIKKAFLFLSLAVCIGFSAFGIQKAVRSEQADGYVYWIKEYNGKVAVFENNAQQPQEILDCPLDSLPNEEIKRIQNGIPVSSPEELQQWIEAYD